MTTSADLFCPDCGYNLYGLPAGRCPECGGEFDAATFSVPTLPWANHSKIGRFAAYGYSLRLAIFHPFRMAKESARPVNYTEAQRFRWIAVGVCWLAWAAAPAVVMAKGARQGIVEMYANYFRYWPPRSFGLGESIYLPLTQAYMYWFVPPLAIALFLALVSGVHSYFFHPSYLPIERQNRAVALSYYVCAPMFWGIVPAVIFYFAMFKYGLFVFDYLSPAGVVIAILPLVNAAAMWAIILVLLARTTGCSAARVLIAAVAIPLFWIIIAAITLVCLPWLLGWLMIALA